MSTEESFTEDVDDFEISGDEEQDGPEFSYKQFSRLQR